MRIYRLESLLRRAAQGKFYLSPTELYGKSMLDGMKVLGWYCFGEEAYQSAMLEAYISQIDANLYEITEKGTQKLEEFKDNRREG